MALTTAIVTISDTQMKALSTTPVTLIAAPGAGQKLICFGLHACCNISTNGGTNVTGTVRYAVANTAAFPSFTMITGGINGARETSQAMSTFNQLSPALTNRAIELTSASSAGSSYASIDGFHIAILYDVMNDPN